MLWSRRHRSMRELSVVGLGLFPRVGSLLGLVTMPSHEGVGARDSINFRSNSPLAPQPLTPSGISGRNSS
jgi:hypothetical protein